MSVIVIEVPVMPQYQCHKKVRAARIVEIHGNSDDSCDLQIDLGIGVERAKLTVPDEWMMKHSPVLVGGYLVRYDDGCLSYSPEQAFEEGYKAC